MKKILVLIFIIIFLLIGCNNISEVTYAAEPKKLYEITVYKCEPKLLETIGAFAKEMNITSVQFIKFIIEEPNRSKIIKKVYDVMEIEIFQANEIISSSETTIRFIDFKNNIEQFINADYIEIEQIK